MEEKVQEIKTQTASYCCRTMEDLKSYAEKMSQKGLEQYHLWCCVANLSKNIRKDSLGEEPSAFDSFVVKESMIGDSSETRPPQGGAPAPPPPELLNYPVQPSTASLLPPSTSPSAGFFEQPPAAEAMSGTDPRCAHFSYGPPLVVLHPLSPPTPSLPASRDQPSLDLSCLEGGLLTPKVSDATKISATKTILDAPVEVSYPGGNPSHGYADASQPCPGPYTGYTGHPPAPANSQSLPSPSPAPQTGFHGDAFYSARKDPRSSYADCLQQQQQSGLPSQSASVLPGQQDHFLATAQRTPGPPAQTSSRGWFRWLFPWGEKKDHLPSDTDKSIVWDESLQKWVDRRAAWEKTIPPSQTTTPPMGNDAMQNGVNKYSVKAVPVHRRWAYPSWKNCWPEVPRGSAPPPPVLTPCPSTPITMPLLPAPQDPFSYLLAQSWYGHGARLF